MAARSLIEWRDADEAMDSGFAGEQAEGVFTFELDGGVFDAGLFAGRFVEDGGAKAFALGPSQIHAKQDGGPVLGFGAASAGLDGHDGVEVIVFAGEQRLRFEFRNVFVGGIEFAIELLEQIVFLLGVALFAREVDVGFDVAGDGVELRFGGDLVFGFLALAQN